MAMRKDVTMDEELRRDEKIRGAYHSVGRLASLYDGMMTYSTWSGKFVSRLVWGLDRAGVARYVGLALRAMGRLAESERSYRRAIGLSLIGGTGTYVVISLLLT